MKTKGANLLLATMLIASCVTAPAFAEDAKEAKDAESTETSGDSKVASTGSKSGPDQSKAPAEPSAEDKANIGTDRGIIITEINPSNKSKTSPSPDHKSAATTLEIRTGKTAPALIRRTSTAGDATFSRGLVIEQPKSITPVKKQNNLLIKPPTKKVSTEGSKTGTTTVEIHKNSTTPLKVKTATPPAQTAKATQAPKNEQSTGKHQVAIDTVIAQNGDQIVTAWLNKPGKSPHYKDGERLQVNVQVNKDCNLMIFNYDGDQLTQLYPNAYQVSPFVKAGQTVNVGGEGFKFDFTASNQSGKASHEKIFVYAYPIENDTSPITVAMAKIPDSPFRATEMTAEQYRDMVRKSEVFFGRKVKVQPKKGGVEEVQLASFESTTQSAAPNKIELSLVIDGSRKN